ncbi:MAG: hypothetical protein V3S20_04700 [Dehalococcoidia bacterium]
MGLALGRRGRVQAQDAPVGAGRCTLFGESAHVRQDDVRRLRRVRGQAIDDGEEFQGREAVSNFGLGGGEEQRIVVHHKQRLDSAVAQHLVERQAWFRGHGRAPGLLEFLACGVVAHGAVTGEVFGGGADVPHPPDVRLLRQHEQSAPGGRPGVPHSGHGHVGGGGGQYPRLLGAQVRQRQDDR